MVQRKYEVKTLSNFTNKYTGTKYSLIESLNIDNNKIFYVIKTEYSDGAMSTKGYDSFLEAMVNYNNLEGAVS